jgi:tetratricopeptide (TPR) repeat protein
MTLTRTDVTAAEFAAAKLAFDRAPHEFATAYTFGAVALAAGELAAATSALATAAKHVEDKKGAAATLWALALAQSGDQAGAARAASIAADRQPSDASVQQQAVAALRRIGDEPGAMTYAERLAALQDDAAAWADVGAAYARLKRHADAVHAFGKAEARDPNFFQRAAYEAQLRTASIAALETR